MRNKFKAFIGIAIISLSLFVTPVGVFLSTVDVTGSGETAVTVSIDSTVATAQETTTLTEAELECAFTNLMGCLADLVRIVFGIFWWFTQIAGKFLDFFINYSTSSLTYAQGSDFVHRGWALVRDISNIFFIFVLLYIAIGTILNLSQVDTKKMLTKVIIIALLINFSLFFTKIVIDASNILARAFMGSMQINVTDVNGNPIESNVQQFSVAIVAKFNPNQLLDNTEGSPYYALQREDPNTASTLRLVMLLAGIAILAVMVWTFFKVGLFFLARVITLWLVMITAPIAFISIVLPFNIPKLGHQEWTKSLFSSAFMAPIFLFFMYLIIVFLDMGFFDQLALNSSQGFGDMMLRIIIPFIIIMMLVLQAAKISEKMSGEIGSVVAKVGGAALGLAAAGVTGGTAMLARKGIGAAGARIASNATLKDHAAGRSGNFATKYLAQATRGVGKGAASSSFDWRQSESGKKIMQSMGMDTIGAGSVGMGRTAGGYTGSRERYIAGQQKRAADLEVSEDESTMQSLRQAENNLTKFENNTKEWSDILQKNIDDFRQTLNDERGGPNEGAARADLNAALANMSDFKNGNAFDYVDATGALQTEEAKKFDDGTPGGKNLKQLKADKSNAENAVVSTNNSRRDAIGDDITKGLGPGLSKIAASLAGLSTLTPVSGYKGSERTRNEAAYKVKQGKKEEKKPEA